jgi:hypothetical protein
MRDRLRALYLDANGVGRQMLVVDTVLRQMLGYQTGDRPPAPLQRYRWINALFAELRDVYAELSYAADWREAFLSSADLMVEVCNINNLVHFGRCLLQLRQYELIVVSHVAAGDDLSVLLRAARWFDRRRGPLVVFIGNEYDLLDDKIAFIREAEAEFICSQLPSAAAGYLYQECEKSRIVEMPHALNPRAYFPDPEIPHSIDVGFVGEIYWPFVGDRERTDLIEWFERHGAKRGLRCDIRRQRLARHEWRRFLSSCKTTIGAESGTYYLNERGKLLERARAYNLLQNRNASFDEVFDRYYHCQPRGISGKTISSRHFETIGTKTCQILISGEYNGILEANRHYISLCKDLGNIDEALEQFHDENHRLRIVEETYDLVITQHTYAHRVDSLLKIVTASGKA